LALGGNMKEPHGMHLGIPNPNIFPSPHTPPTSPNWIIAGPLGSVSFTEKYDSNLNKGFFMEKKRPKFTRF